MSNMSSKDEHVDLDFLTQEERDVILAVLARDENLRRNEEERIEQLKREMRKLRAQEFSRISYDATKICGRCLVQFGWLVNRGQICCKCRLRVCKTCRQLLNNRTWFCLVCLKILELESQTGSWFYLSYPKNKKNKSSSQIISAVDVLRSSLSLSPLPDGTPLPTDRSRDHVTSMTHLPEIHRLDDEDEDLLSDSDSLLGRYLSSSTPNLSFKNVDRSYSEDKGSLTNLYVVDPSELQDDVYSPYSEKSLDFEYASNDEVVTTNGGSTLELMENDRHLIKADDKAVIMAQGDGSIYLNGSTHTDEGRTTADDDDPTSRPDLQNISHDVSQIDFSFFQIATENSKLLISEGEMPSNHTSDGRNSNLETSSSHETTLTKHSQEIIDDVNQGNETSRNIQSNTSNIFDNLYNIPTVSPFPPPSSDPVRQKVSALLAKYGRQETVTTTTTGLGNNNDSTNGQPLRANGTSHQDSGRDNDLKLSPKPFSIINVPTKNEFFSSEPLRPQSLDGKYKSPNNNSSPTSWKNQATSFFRQSPGEWSHVDEDDSPSYDGGLPGNEDEDDPLERFIKNERLLEKQRKRGEEDQESSPTSPWLPSGRFDLDWDAEDDALFSTRDFDPLPSGFLDDCDDDSQDAYSDLRSVINNILGQSTPESSERGDEDEEDDDESSDTLHPQASLQLPSQRTIIPMLRKKSLSVISEHTEPSACSSFDESSFLGDFPEKDETLVQNMSKLPVDMH